MRRDPLPLLLLLVLVLLGSVAWLTRDPDHPLVDWLAGLPVLGPAAERFRELYRPPPAAPAGDEEPAEVVIVGREIVGRPPGRASPRSLGRVWLAAGSELRREPAAGSDVVARLPGLRLMTLLERRGEWRRVSQVGIDGSFTEGWVRGADLEEPSPEELWRPDPVVPLAAAEPPEETLAQARELMGESARVTPCGPYRLLSDRSGPLIERCPRLAGQLDALYAARTGLDPVGPPAETILLFDSPVAYLIFRSRVSPESRRHAFAAPARGFVAVAAGGRATDQVQATLVHELVHLLNRRFLGPALPPWLDEGLAEDMAMSRIAEDGTLTPGVLGRWEAGTERARLVGGGEVVLEELRARMRRGDLPTLERLVRLDRRSFQAEERFQVHYSLAAFWVRFLLAGGAPGGAEGFRGFLAAVAGGEPLSEELLLGHLGAGWPELQEGFQRWLDGAG